MPALLHRAAINRSDDLPVDLYTYNCACKKCACSHMHKQTTTTRTCLTWRCGKRLYCQARDLNKEDAMDHGRWKKLIKIGRWSGLWVGECFFWYRLTRAVPDKGCKTIVAVIKARWAGTKKNIRPLTAYLCRYYLISLINFTAVHSVLV